MSISLHKHVRKPAIIFTRTVSETQRITIFLRALGFAALPLHGQLSQSARSGALSKFRAGGACNLLVATDVASRGLDIPSVDLVLNYDLPGDSATYIHRVGRTARAGRSGIAVSFVTQYDVEVWLRIEHALGTKLSEIKVDEGEVVAFAERVGEAQKVAVREMKVIRDKKRNVDARHRDWGKSLKSRDDVVIDEG